MKNNGFTFIEVMIAVFILGLAVIALLGSMIAFFRYNFYPARIFLGDSGSTFAGFMIASVSVLWVIFSGITFSLIIPLIILSIPIGDTVFAIWRRWRNHKPIFQADQGHLHHRLLRRGILHHRVVLILIGMNTIFCLIALTIVVSYLR